MVRLGVIDGCRHKWGVMSKTVAATGQGFLFCVQFAMNVSLETLKCVLTDATCGELINVNVDNSEDLFFPTVGKLENLSKVRQESEICGPCQLSAFNDKAKIQRSFELKAGPENYTFLVWRGTEEEVCLDVQGLIASCALPPISHRTQ